MFKGPATPFSETRLRRGLRVVPSKISTIVSTWIGYQSSTPLSPPIRNAIFDIKKSTLEINYFQQSEASLFQQLGCVVSPNSAQPPKGTPHLLLLPFAVKTYLQRNNANPPTDLIDPAHSTSHKSPPLIGYSKKSICSISSPLPSPLSFCFSWEHPSNGARKIGFCSCFWSSPSTILSDYVPPVR